MNMRPLTQALAGATVLVAAGAIVPLGSAAAAPPAVDSFDVEFVDDSCGPGLDALTNLHVQFTDKVLPDGSLHHWLDLSGTLVNPADGLTVTVHAARRFTDSQLGESSVFRGLQGQFSAAGVGVLMHTSGWSDDVTSHGRWDGVPTNALPASVCDYLFGES